jgi:electron transfer flavoprotein beta subunit
LKVLIFIKPVKCSLLSDYDSYDSEYTINPYDLYCLNQLTKLKKRHDIHITSIMMGVSNAKDSLIKVLASGSDNVILLNDNECFAGADTIATSNVLAQAARKIGFDCLIFGDKTVDGETGQVKYEVSELLEIPICNNIIEITDICFEKIKFRRVSDKRFENIITSLPIILSFQGYTLKYDNVSLLELKRAKNKEITIWSAKDIEIDKSLCGFSGSKTRVVKVLPIVTEKNTRNITGDINEIANDIRNILNIN